MYSVLYNLYFMLCRKRKKRKEKSFIVEWIIGYIEAYYNLFVVKRYRRCFFKNYGITRKKREQKIIVSLTSFPKRIGTVWITVETLLRQSVKPDEIILWLAQEQFDGLESLPQELLEQQERGLTIRFCDDLRSHKKYYYAMQEYPNDLIVLADDDFFYSYDLVKKLYSLHKKNPRDIVCISTALIHPEYMSPPSIWERPGVKEKIEHSFLAQPFTGAGTLYPPKSIPLEAFQKGLIMDLCPYADDLWLKFVSLLTHTPVTAIYKNRSFPITIYGTASSSLWRINGAGKKNDEQWKNLLEYFPKEAEKFKTFVRGTGN